jgi:methanethiol oxidase
MLYLAGCGIGNASWLFRLLNQRLRRRTCSSPYLARIEGQEEFVYVWTLGVEGLGDGADKLVVVDVKPGSPSYGEVIYSYSVEGRHEAHHGGFTDDRRQLWLAGLESSKIFIFDVYTDPARPRYLKTIDNFEKVTGGAVGPHGVYALPGRVLVPCLSNAKDKGGRTALVEYNNEGDYIATHWLPAKETLGLPGAEFADGYGYDARVLPRKNVLMTTSFTGWNKLQPILDAYGQAVQRKENPYDPTGPLYHNLRFFLIDRSGRVRNIHSSGTLDVRLVLADVQTLLMEPRY